MDAPSESPSLRQFQRVADARLWWPRRPLATLDRKPRQGRKAATVSIDAGAEASRRGHRHSRLPHIQHTTRRFVVTRSDGLDFSSCARPDAPDR